METYSLCFLQSVHGDFCFCSSPLFFVHALSWQVGGSRRCSPLRAVRRLGSLKEKPLWSRLGKMLTQDLYVLSPLSPAPPTAAVNPGVHPSGHALPTGLPLAGFLSFFPTYSYKPSSTASSFFPFHCTFYQPTSCLHSFHFLETNSFGFPNFQPFYLPMSSASLLSLAPPNPSRHGQQSNIKDKKELETPWC